MEQGGLWTPYRVDGKGSMIKQRGRVWALWLSPPALLPSLAPEQLAARPASSRHRTRNAFSGSLDHFKRAYPEVTKLKSMPTSFCPEVHRWWDPLMYQSFQSKIWSPGTVRHLRNTWNVKSLKNIKSNIKYKKLGGSWLWQGRELWRYMYY